MGLTKKHVCIIALVIVIILISTQYIDYKVRFTNFESYIENDVSKPTAAFILICLVVISIICVLTIIP